MCKCEKKVENGNEVAVGVVMGIVDLLDEIFGDAANETKKWENSVDLDKEIDHVVFNRSEEHTSELQSRGHLVC